MNALAALFITISSQYGLPSGLLASLCFVESGHKVATIHSNDGGSDSLGVCQIKLETAQALGFKGNTEDLMLPRNNVKYAGLYLKYQLNRYHGDVARAVVAYNRGNARHLTSSRYQVRVFKEWRTANVTNN